MQIKDLDSAEVLNKPDINNQFFSVYLKKMQLNCKILNSNFYLDSFNYFPITEENHTFKKFFSWGENKTKFKNFYNENFIVNFEKNKDNFKTFENTFILGSSISDDYYRNLVTFLPRIFFITKKNINLAIHRNSSNKFRKFVSYILNQQKIRINKLIFLDDNFYKFNNSQIPQYFNTKISSTILRKFISLKRSRENKIYVSRQNSSYRNLINEHDIIQKLKDKNFQIVDVNNMSIIEQIKVFSKADTIISPTSSALTNIIFSPIKTRIIEIIPKYKYEYEKEFKERYFKLCKLFNLSYISVEADPIDKKTKNKFEHFISKKILNESNYYKDMIIKKNEFDRLIRNI